MVKTAIFYPLLVLLCCFQEERQESISMGAFTHPFELKNISVYSDPSTESSFTDMSPGEEGGWRITLLEKHQDFFKSFVTEGPRAHDTIWLQQKDVGITVQNYDSIPIPVFSTPENNTVIDTICWSTTAYVINFTRNQACISYFEDEKFSIGWVFRHYLCDNPMTTCN